MKYDTDGDGLGPDYDLYMPSGKGVYLGVVEAVQDAGKVNAIQSVNLGPRTTPRSASPRRTIPARAPRPI